MTVDDLHRPAPRRLSTASASRSTRRASAPTSSSTGRRSTSSRCRSATSCASCSRRSTRTTRVRVIVLRAIGEHFSTGGNIKGFMEATPETRLEARLEHRRAGALRQAGDRRQPRLLLRRRLRALARLRFPHRLGDLPLRAARAEARPDPGLGRLGAAAEDGRHHPHQGHRDALASAFRASRPTTGASPPNACRTPSSEAATDALVDELRTFSPLAQRTAKKLLNDTEDSHAVDRDRAGRPLLQPAAPVGRLQRRRRGVPRQAPGQVQGDLRMKWCRFTAGGETSFGLIEGRTRRAASNAAPWGAHTIDAQQIFAAQGREARTAGDPEHVLLRRRELSRPRRPHGGEARHQADRIRRGRTSAIAPTTR